MPLQIGRRLRAQAPFFAVLAIFVATFIYLLIQPDHWRRGSAAMATAMMLAGVLRATLTSPRAGWLAVRGKWRDTSCYVALGLVILIAAIELG